MARRGSRPIIFVCGDVSVSGELICESIIAPTQTDAISTFKNKYGQPPKTVLGPFYQKKKQILENTRSLKFTNEVKKAEYDGWIVNAMILADPAHHAFLVFLNRVDGKKMNIPTGTIVVPCSNLRLI